MTTVREKVQNLFSRVSSVIDDRKQKRSATYQSFVVDVANGKDVRPEALAEAIESAGKSVEQFQSDVDLVLKRREWKAMCDSEPQLRAEYDRLSKQNSDSQKEYERKREEMRQERIKEENELQTKINQAYRKIDECSTARAKLEETSSLKQELIDLYDSKSQPNRKLDSSGEFMRDVRAAEAVMNSAKEELARLKGSSSDFITMNSSHGGAIQEAENKYRSAKAKFDALKCEVDQSHAQIDAIDKQIKSVYAKAITVV